LIMEDFTPVGDWFVFHNSPSLQDWKTPVGDVIEEMKKVPNQDLKATGKPALQP